MPTLITAERLRHVIDYDPETGIFKWRGVLSGRGYSPAKVGAGVEAGCPDTDGYRLICIDRRLYRSNKLAWLYMTGEWPTGFIDHKDLDPMNDRWINLREATCSQNNANRGHSQNNKLAVKGVHRKDLVSGTVYVAQICKNRKRHFLGVYPTIGEASAAYAEAAQRLFGEFARAA